MKISDIRLVYKESCNYPMFKVVVIIDENTYDSFITNGKDKQDVIDTVKLCYKNVSSINVIEWRLD